MLFKKFKYVNFQYPHSLKFYTLRGEEFFLFTKINEDREIDFTDTL